MLAIVTPSAFARIKEPAAPYEGWGWGGGAGSVLYHDYNCGSTNIPVLKFREIYINLKEHKMKGFSMLALMCQPFPKVYFQQKGNTLITQTTS